MSRIGSPEAWHGAATLQARSITVDGEQIAHCEARCGLSDGVLSVQQLQGIVCGGTLDGEASLLLRDLQDFQGHTSIRDANIGLISLLSQRRRTTAITGNMNVAASAADELLQMSGWHAARLLVQNLSSAVDPSTTPASVSMPIRIRLK